MSPIPHTFSMSWRIWVNCLDFLFQAVINIKEACVYVYHTLMCMFKNYFLCPLSFHLRNEERKLHYYTSHSFAFISGTGVTSLQPFHGWYVYHWCYIPIFSKLDSLHQIWTHTYLICLNSAKKPQQRLGKIIAKIICNEKNLAS